ncbi:MAG: allB [Bacteroidota bacterium]|nr:allB [Bacteroidota bacterium]
MLQGIVIISDGRIADITNEIPANVNCEIIDAQNKVVMAGVIDPHVHINEPGRTEWEGFDTATRSAIAGGITTLVDMPLNSSPVTTSVKTFEEKLSATKNKLHTNVGFWGGVVPWNTNELKGLIDNGVLGFKAFLTHSGIDEFPNVTEDDLRKAMPVIAKYKLPLLVHCELSDDDHPCKGDPSSYKNYLATRPTKWEDDAIALMIRLCEEFNCRTHIVHLSSANSIEQIYKAKQKGLPLTVETGQHYLYYTAEEIRDGKTVYKCAPPIRDKENNEQIWQALKDGIIDFVATDHSPSTPDLKEQESGNFMKAWGGIASIQLALPVLWTVAKKRNCTFGDMAKWLCSNPAKLIGKQKNKGKIEKGYDADIVIWDAGKKFTVKADELHHKHKITPYLHEELFGVVEQAFLEGRKVFDHGNVTENLGKIILR